MFQGKLISHVPFIGFDDIDADLTWMEISEALRRGHQMAPAIHEDVYLEHSGKGFFNRCAFIPGLGLATKSVTVFPQNRIASPPLATTQGIVSLFEDTTGQVLATFDGELITKWKTTGDSILAARLLARPDARKLVIAGAGAVGGYALEAYCEVFPKISDIVIWNRSFETAQQLAANNAHRPQTVTATSSLRDAVASADIISCATSSPEPVLSGDWVPAGCHVDLVGAFRPDMREADDNLILKSKTFVDSRRSTFTDIGEIAIPLSEGTITESHILGDYYDLCNGYEFKRERDDITFFKNGGGGHLDLMCTHYIYKKFIDRTR